MKRHFNKLLHYKTITYVRMMLRTSPRRPSFSIGYSAASHIDRRRQAFPSMPNL